MIDSVYVPVEFKKGVIVDVASLNEELQFNATIGTVNRSDYFRETDIVKELPLDTRWEDIAVESGIFPSRGQARKNGWEGAVECGWHEKMFGKRKKFIFVHKEMT